MTDKRYPIPAGTWRVEQEIQRSRFITTIGYTPTVEEARAFIARVSEEFADATHNCWAHVIGPPGSTGMAGMSDAGEPHGTAGRPMLTTLLHSGVGDVTAVVTRYFGGTKLGKGGLVRAYSGSVQHALESLPTREHVRRAELAVEIDYASIDGFQRLLPDYEAEITTEEYGAGVRYRLTVPVQAVDRFRDAVQNLTSGQAAVEVIESGEE